MVGMKLWALLFCAGLAGAQPFHLEKTIPVPGIEGKIDHLAVDVQGKRLILSAAASNTAEVLDLAAGRHLQSLPGMHEPQGAWYVAEVHKFYVANGKDGKLRAIDEPSLKPAGEFEFGEDADNVRYDAARKLIWVGWEDGTLGALDVTTGKRAGNNIYLDGHPESFQLEKGGTRIFANVPDAGEIEVVDRVKRIILAKWEVKDAEANYAMALDEAHHRVLVVTRKPARMRIYDMETGKMTAEFPCPGDCDDIFYDAARQRVYVAGGEGFLEAFQQKSADEYQSLGKIATATKARTGMYVPEWSRIYLAVPHMGQQAAEVRVYSVE